MSSVQDPRQAMIKGNNADPDDAKSWLCSACKLPIFFTPYISNTNDGGGGEVFLHDQCANLPKEVKVCDLHSEKALLLRENEPASNTVCSECSEECGTKLYHCPDPDFQLDVACALTIKILHWSHNHRLMAIRARGKLSSLICSVCGTKHKASTSSNRHRSYLCNACGFWMHPDCAELPNIIKHKHDHPLVLSYDVPATSGPKSSTLTIALDLIIGSFSQGSATPDRGRCKCVICTSIIRSLGLYSCNKCSYYVHISCALSDTRNFKPVLIREARLPDLVHDLPVPDEHKSLIHYVTDATNSSGVNIRQIADMLLILRSVEIRNAYIKSWVHFVEQKIKIACTSIDHSVGKALYDLLHKHEDDRLTIFPGDDVNYDDDHPRACKACVKSISPPFYRCSECQDFFLHECCRHLPSLLSSHPAHNENHPLLLHGLSSGLDENQFRFMICSHCDRPSTGFVYSCLYCKNFHMDVLCALMPVSITHNAHSKTHILSLLGDTASTGAPPGKCECCGESLENKRGYECRICRNFALHTWCAMLPDTVRHKFDEHPLKLITIASSKWSSSESSSSSYHDTLVCSQDQLKCEVCESGIDNNLWYYSCKICNQSFHIDCIPRVVTHSNIKFGNTTCLRCHDCHLTLVGLTLCGYRCDRCGKTFNVKDDKLAFECSDCCFFIDIKCAKEEGLSVAEYGRESSEEDS